MNNQNNNAYERGYATLPIEEYTGLINELYELRNIVSLTTTYSNQVTVQFNKDTVYKLAKRLYETSEYNTPDRELKPRESFSVWTADLTDAVLPANENEESAAEG